MRRERLTGVVVSLSALAAVAWWGLGRVEPVSTQNPPEPLVRNPEAAAPVPAGLLPRDRAGTFEPQLVKKNQTHLTDELERKILSMFAQGMSYQAIRDHVQEMYDINVPNGTINAITDKLIPELKAWQERELEPIYPIVWLDAIHYKIKDNGRFVMKAVYTILGVNLEGKKELLGI